MQRQVRGSSLVGALAILTACSSPALPPQEGERLLAADASSSGPDAGGHDTDGAGQLDAPQQASAAVATAVVVGSHHACALDAAGGVRCWGDNRYGQLGDRTTTMRKTPVPVQGLPRPATAIAAGDNHTGSTASQLTSPTQVLALSEAARSLGAGGATTCAVTVSSSAFCWGENVSGQLGDGSNASRNVPSPTAGILGPVAVGTGVIGAGADHTCMIAADGSVGCAGDDSNGALGNGANASTNSYVVSGIAGGATALGGSPGVSCALLDDGTVDCWGFGGAGALGNGGTDSTNLPSPVSGLAGVTGLAVGLHHACAASPSGVFCWGSNEGGNLGDGSGMQQSTPVAVPALSAVPVAAVAAGGGSCALTTAGAVLCWGSNAYGEVGDGTTSPRPTPVAVVGFP
jgi:alpha-tubulin suppressor-like RCC1 family protein